MANFQYVGEGHTLVRTSKESSEKTKVVAGEIVAIEDGVHSESRLSLAGFRRVAGIVAEAAADVAETVAEAAAEVSETVSEAADAVEDVLSEAAGTPDTAPEGEEKSESGETAENDDGEAEGTRTDEEPENVVKPSKNAKKAAK